LNEERVKKQSGTWLSFENERYNDTIYKRINLNHVLTRK